MIEYFYCTILKEISHRVNELERMDGIYTVNKKMVYLLEPISEHYLFTGA